jgi:hypothetical protein
MKKSDLVAGGFDKIADFGDRSVNSSIGSQWRSRIGELDKAANEALAAGLGDAKMNAKLTRCK